MKKLSFICFLIFANCLPIFAQKTGKISGKLLDEKKQALPFANILLLKASDSTLVKGAISEENGSFILDQIADNQYIISISSVGYQKYYSPKIIISPENTSVNLPIIQLVLETKTLGSVTITAKKPLIEMQADKMVMNVENSIISTGSTAMEVLQKAPGVLVDQNDNITLKGKSGILIYMDGKPTYMSQSDLANLLKNMGSDQIEKIEIISNPSARYDASGKAIINIVTKKNQNFGTNGSLSFGTVAAFSPTLALSEVNGVIQYKNFGIKPRYNTSLNINNRKGKFNLFGNLSFNDGKGVQGNVFSRIVSSTIYDQYAYHENAWNNFSYKAGADYFMNKKTTIGLLIKGNEGSWQNPSPSVNNSYIKTLEGVLQSSPLTTSSGFNSWASTTINTNYKHTFDSTGKELTADFDYSFYNNLSRERGMTTNFYDASGNIYSPALHITSNIPNKYNITAIKVDYALPISKSKAKFEFGGKSSWVKSDNDIRFFNNDINDINRTNHFVYTENVNALYGNFSKEFNKIWSLQAGLRLENTQSEGNSLTLNQSKSKEYTNLFPSAFLKQTIDKNNQIAYSYSRRIQRPDYESLNPFVYFLDPYTYELGNEYLRPQFTNSFEINHTFKQTFITTIGYSRSTDYITQMIRNATDDPETFAKIQASSAGTAVDPSKVTFAIQENVPLYENFNLGFAFPIKFYSWWNANNNASIFNNKYSGSVGTTSFNSQKTSYNFNSSHVFSLPKATTIEASIWYNSPAVYGQIQADAQYAVNLGIKKSIFKKKADIKLTVNDLFNTNHFHGIINSGGINMVLDNHWSSRYVGINFVYKFGNSNVKSARNRSTATEAEQNRVKSGN